MENTVNQIENLLESIRDIYEEAYDYECDYSYSRIDRYFYHDYIRRDGESLTNIIGILINDYGYDIDKIIEDTGVDRKFIIRRLEAYKQWLKINQK